MGPCEGQNRALTCSLININGGRKMWTLAETELWSCQPCRQSWSFNYGDNISAHTDVWISHSMFGQTVSKTLGSILSDVNLSLTGQTVEQASKSIHLKFHKGHLFEHFVVLTCCIRAVDANSLNYSQQRVSIFWWAKWPTLLSEMSVWCCLSDFMVKHSKDEQWT